MSSMSEEELVAQIEALETVNGELEDKVAQLTEKLDEVTNTMKNLRNVVDEAREAAHNLWYNLGNA